MRILRASDRIAVPWKNGGGTTSEVAVYPDGASFDDFGWRISIAQIAKGGPFSTFPGIDRKLAMLDGRVTLTIAGQDVVALSPASPPAIFPGDAPTSAELVEGPATDLNVMTRRGAFTARMERCRLSGCDLAASRDAAARFCFPRASTSVSHHDDTIRLAPDDALLFDTEDTERLSFSGDVDALWIEIRRKNPTK
ncbi:MAG TPA: HutD family protein [Rhizomicrobium sp.]